MGTIVDMSKIYLDLAIFEHTNRNMSETMRYPLTAPSKFLWYPHKWMWQHCRGLRWWAYSVVVCMPVFMTLDSALNSPEQVEFWSNKRKGILEHMVAWKKTPSLEDSHH